MLVGWARIKACERERWREGEGKKIERKKRKGEGEEKIGERRKIEKNKIKMNIRKGKERMEKIKKEKGILTYCSLVATLQFTRPDLLRNYEFKTPALEIAQNPSYDFFLNLGMSTKREEVIF